MEIQIGDSERGENEHGTGCLGHEQNMLWNVLEVFDLCWRLAAQMSTVKTFQPLCVISNPEHHFDKRLYIFYFE